MERIGLIGLGNIGQFYTKQLLAAGYPLTVLDLDAEKVKIATDQGAIAGKTLATWRTSRISSLSAFRVVQPSTPLCRARTAFSRIYGWVSRD